MTGTRSLVLFTAVGLTIAIVAFAHEESENGSSHPDITEEEHNANRSAMYEHFDQMHAAEPTPAGPLTQHLQELVSNLPSTIAGLDLITVDCRTKYCVIDATLSSRDNYPMFTGELQRALLEQHCEFHIPGMPHLVEANQGFKARAYVICQPFSTAVPPPKPMSAPSKSKAPGTFGR